MSVISVISITFREHSIREVELMFEIKLLEIISFKIVFTN